MSTSRRPLVAAVALMALVAASCGYEGGGSSTEEFCAEVEAQEANADLDLNDPEALAEFNALIDDAPEEVRPALEEFRDVAEEFESLDENDPDAFGAVFALFGDPDFLRALQDLAVFMADECGLEVEGIDELRELDPDDPGALFESFGGGAVSDPTDGSGTDGSGPEDDDPSDTDQLSTFIDENDAATSWADAVVGKAIGTFGDSADITVSLDAGSLDEGDGVEACEAVSQWAEGFYVGDVTVNVTDLEGDELATAADGGPCRAA